MRSLISSLLLVGLVLAQATGVMLAQATGVALAQATGVKGEWIAKAVNRTISLKIEEVAGVITGTLDGMGETFTLKGQLNGLKAEGTATSTSGEAYFSFVVKGDSLSLSLANFDQNGKPDLSSAVTVVLERDFGPKAQAGFSVPGFAPPPIDPLIATWRNANVILSLKNLGPSKYTGTIEMAKQKAVITATGNHMNLKGSFKLGQQNKTFSAKLENDRLKFVMDGKTQILGRAR
jgi:hypothetical protein